MCVDSDTALEMIKEGICAINKLEEIIIGIFNPRWIKNKADAEIYAGEKRLEFIRNNPDMEISFEKGEISVWKKGLEDNAKQRMLADAIRQEENIEKLIKMVMNEIKENEIVSDEPVDEDWVVRFFDIAKDVSAEEMQILWAKVLAGEIRKPGEFSLRTLDFMKNLSQKEALTIQKIIPFLLKTNESNFMLVDKELLAKYGVNPMDILLLDDIGFIQIKDGLSINCDVEKLPYNLNIDEPTITIVSKDGLKHHVSMPIFSLTTAGNELYAVFEMNVNIEYLIEFLKKQQERHINENVGIHLYQLGKDILVE